MGVKLSKLQNCLIPFEVDIDGEKITGKVNIGKYSKKFFETIDNEESLDVLISNLVEEWDICEEVEIEVEVKKDGKRVKETVTETIPIPVDRANEVPYYVLKEILDAIRGIQRPNPQPSKRTGSFS